MRAAREYHGIDDVRRWLAPRLPAAASVPLFDRPQWYGALHRHCFADRPVRAIVAEEGGAVAWAFLVDQGRRRTGALANWYSFSWRPCFIGGPDPAVRDELLQRIVTGMLAKGARVDLYPVEDAASMLAAVRAAGWIAVSRPMGGRHVLDVRGRSFARYWAERPGHLRALVKRKGRGDPFALTIHDRLTDALWQDYVDVHARSWKAAEPAGGLALLHELAAWESAAGRLRLGFARQDGRAVATQLWTIDGDTALIHKLSHDRASDKGSPGTLLSHAMFAHAIDQDRVARIDYGTGDNAYKADWMERRVPLHRIDAFNPRCASAWLPAARATISALVG